MNEDITVGSATGRYFSENRAHAELGRESRRSGMTFVAARGINVFVQIASTILLARLLSPHDFGIVAMITALVGFAPVLIDLGTSDAATQKARISEDEISALFWTNVGIGVCLAGLMIVARGGIADAFGEPALAGIALVTSVTFPLMAISNQHYALMRRAMEFHRIATIDISANLIGTVVSIAMALAGCGYWSLVVKPIVTSAIVCVGAWWFCRWVPSRPRASSGVGELARFGLGVTGFTLTDYFARSADRLAIGYFFGAASLGYFQNAFTIYSNVLSILSEPLHNIAASGLSKLRDDPAQLRRLWAKALSLVSFVSAPIFAILAVTGQDVVVMLLGAKWAASGPLVCILAARGIAQTAERTLGWLHVAAGRSDRWLRWGFVSAALQVAAVIAGLPFGPIGLTTSCAALVYLLLVPAIAYSGQPFGIGARDVIQAVGPQIVGALAATACAMAVQQIFLGELMPVLRVALSVAMLTTIYLAIVVGLFRVTEPIRVGLSTLRDFRRRRAVGLPEGI